MSKKRTAMTVRLPVNIYEELRHLSFVTRIPMHEVIVDGVEEAIARYTEALVRQVNSVIPRGYVVRRKP